MKHFKLFFIILTFASCTKQECKPLTCKVTQWDYTVCWSPDNSHQYIVFDDAEVQYLDTDECELETVLKPMFQHNDSLGIYRFPTNIQKEIKNKPTQCDCY